MRFFWPFGQPWWRSTLPGSSSRPGLEVHLPSATLQLLNMLPCWLDPRCGRQQGATSQVQATSAGKSGSPHVFSLLQYLPTCRLPERVPQHFLRRPEGAAHLATMHRIHRRAARRTESPCLTIIHVHTLVKSPFDNGRRFDGYQAAWGPDVMAITQGGFDCKFTRSPHNYSAYCCPFRTRTESDHQGHVDERVTAISGKMHTAIRL